MPYFELADGGRIRYEIIGSGEPMIVTPGGAAGLDTLWPMAHPLSRTYQVILWDRRNTGLSDISFDGASEGLMWREDMKTFLEHLDVGPVHVLGGSGGSRMSLLFAIAHPEMVRRLVLWNAVGGMFAATILAGTRYTPLIQAAWIGGMEAVAQSSKMAKLIEANPRNYDLLMKWEPEPFIERLKQWALFYLPDPPGAVLTGGMTEEMLQGLTVPTLIFQGGDDTHPPELTEEYHRLIPDSTLIKPAKWDSHDWWRLWSEDAATGNAAHFAVWRELVPEIIEFLQAA